MSHYTYEGYGVDLRDFSFENTDFNSAIKAVEDKFDYLDLEVPMPDEVSLESNCNTDDFGYLVYIPNIESVAEVKPKPIKQLTKKEANKTLALVIFELANYAYPKFSELDSDEFSKAIKAEVDHLADFSWAHCWTDWD